MGFLSPSKELSRGHRRGCRWRRTLGNLSPRSALLPQVAVGKCAAEVEAFDAAFTGRAVAFRAIALATT